jgi:hypothetical protein
LAYTFVSKSHAGAGLFLTGPHETLISLNALRALDIANEDDQRNTGSNPGSLRNELRGVLCASKAEKTLPGLLGARCF